MQPKNQEIKDSGKQREIILEKQNKNEICYLFIYLFLSIMLLK